MTHIIFKQDSGCACEWALLRTLLGCFRLHQSLSVAGGGGGGGAPFM